MELKKPFFLLNKDPPNSITVQIAKARYRVQRYECLGVITKLAVRNWGLSTNEENCEMSRRTQYWKGFVLSRDWTPMDISMRHIRHWKMVKSTPQ